MEHENRNNNIGDSIGDLKCISSKKMRTDADKDAEKEKRKEGREVREELRDEDMRMNCSNNLELASALRGFAPIRCA